MMLWLFLVLQQDDDPLKTPFGKTELRVFQEPDGVLIATIATDGGRPEGAHHLLLQNPRAAINTTPKGPDDKVKRLDMQAAKGRYERGTQTLWVSGDAMIECKAETQSFRSESCTVYFKEKRFETDRPCKLYKPGVLILAGSARSDMALEEHILGGTPQVYIIGDPKYVFDPQVPPEKITPDILTIIECTGPATVLDRKDRIRISTDSPVFVVKKDQHGIMKIRASRAVIDAKRENGRAVPQKISMSGAVRLEESSPMTLTGDSLEWDEAKEEVAVPEGRLKMKEHTITANGITLYKAQRRVVAQGNARAVLRQESGPVDLATDTLTIDLEKQGEETVARNLTAEGATRIKRNDAVIDCRRFRFDIRENSGTVFGGPVAHIVRDTTEIWSPVVAIKGEEFTIGGPKFIRFKDGDKPAAATSGGDIVMRGSTILLQGRAWISTPDFRLTAEEIRIELGDDKKVRTLGAGGGVWLQAVEDGRPVTATGARASQKSGASAIVLEGRPEATLRSEDRRVWANVLTFDQANHKFSAQGTDRPVRMIFEERKNGTHDNRHPR